MKTEKRDSQASQDDCDIYVLGLAKKLRAFSEEERLEIMYDIDGMILSRRRAKQPNRFATHSFMSPSQYSQASSPMDPMYSYSEPLSSEDLYSPNTRMPYSDPLHIHVPQEQPRSHIYSPELPQQEDTNAKKGSKVHIISDQSLRGVQLSDIIAQAYHTA